MTEEQSRAYRIILAHDVDRYLVAAIKSCSVGGSAKIINSLDPVSLEMDWQSFMRAEVSIPYDIDPIEKRFAAEVYRSLTSKPKTSSTWIAELVTLVPEQCLRAAKQIAKMRVFRLRFVPMPQG
ncbi:MAG: hypothetical protein HC888_16685 [Candidatus Competibacteraceae bacterium]|nr:hypothetical protein [Candidatus Competibacteraceae bacterium]